MSKLRTVRMILWLLCWSDHTSYSNGLYINYYWRRKAGSRMNGLKEDWKDRLDRKDWKGPGKGP